MRFRLRRRRRTELEPTAAIADAAPVDEAGDHSEAGLPAVRAERALVALAVHAQQLDERLARVEHRLAEVERIEVPLDVATQDDLLEVRLHSARVSAELTRVAVDLQAKIDDLAVKMPAVVAEDQRLQRARTLAETIIDLSDSFDTNPIDLTEPPGGWAATA